MTFTLSDAMRCYDAAHPDASAEDRAVARRVAKVMLCLQDLSHAKGRAQATTELGVKISRIAGGLKAEGRDDAAAAMKRLAGHVCRRALREHERYDLEMRAASAVARGTED